MNTGIADDRNKLTKRLHLERTVIYIIDCRSVWRAIGCRKQREIKGRILLGLGRGDGGRQRKIIADDYGARLRRSRNNGTVADRRVQIVARSCWRTRDGPMVVWMRRSDGLHRQLQETANRTALEILGGNTLRRRIDIGYL